MRCWRSRRQRATSWCRKEVKRSLYRLEQRGVAVPPHAAATPPPVAHTARRWKVTCLRGRRTRRPAGVARQAAARRLRPSLRRHQRPQTGCARSTCSRRRARRCARRGEELLRKHELRMIDADWRYCDYLIDRALRWAVDSGPHGRRLSRHARPAHQAAGRPTMPPLIFAHVDAAACAPDASLLAESAKLLEEKEFRTWFFDRETLQALPRRSATRSKTARSSSNQAQQQERFRALVERAIEELFGGDHQPAGCGDWKRWRTFSTRPSAPIRRSAPWPPRWRWKRAATAVATSRCASTSSAPLLRLPANGRAARAGGSAQLPGGHAAAGAHRQRGAAANSEW